MIPFCIVNLHSPLASQASIFKVLNRGREMEAMAVLPPKNVPLPVRGLYRFPLLPVRHWGWQSSMA